MRDDEGVHATHIQEIRVSDKEREIIYQVIQVDAFLGQHTDVSISLENGNHSLPILFEKFAAERDRLLVLCPSTDNGRVDNSEDRKHQVKVLG